MISFEVRPHLRAINVVLTFAAVCVAIPGAAQPARGADADDALAQIADAILEAQARGGTYAKELIEPLRNLSFLYQESGNHALELAALEQARQVVRANYGLSSLEQAPLMRQQIRAEESRGNFAQAWELEQALLTLAEKNRDDARTAPIYNEIGDKRMDLMKSYLGGARPPQLFLGCFYKPPQRVGDGVVDRAHEIRGRAGAARVPWLQPARFVDRDARARRDAADAPQSCTEQGGVDRVAGDDRRDVRTVAVDILRRPDFAGIELVLSKKAVEVEASAYDLVVAVGRLEARPCLARARKADGRVIDFLHRRVVTEPHAQPQTE